MTADTRGQMRDVWAIPQFRRVMYSRLVSNIGNGITPVALSFAVLEIEGANGTSLSIVNGALMLSLALFMVAGGVIADRWGRCRVVGLSDILGSIVVGSSALLIITGHASVAFLAANAFVLGALNAVWLPAYRGVVPQLVPPHLLQTANSVNGIFANVFLVVGSAAAGIVVTAFGAGWGVMVDAISFLVAGVLVWSLRGLDSVPEGAENESFFRQLHDGWRGFVDRTWMVAHALGLALYFFAFQGFFSVIGPVQAKDELGGPKAWGLALAGWGLGGLLGVLLAARVRPHRPLRAGWIVMMLNAAWMFAVAAALPLPWVMLGAVLAGIANDFNFILSNTALQTHVPDEILSRVGAYNELAITLFMPLGLVVAGPLVDTFGASRSATAAGMFAILACVVPLMFRSLRMLENVL